VRSCKNIVAKVCCQFELGVFANSQPSSHPASCISKYLWNPVTAVHGQSLKLSGAASESDTILCGSGIRSGTGGAARIGDPKDPTDPSWSLAEVSPFNETHFIISACAWPLQLTPSSGSHFRVCHKFTSQALPLEGN